MRKKLKNQKENNMEKEILMIIGKHHYTHWYKSQEDEAVAKEIDQLTHSHYLKFIKWKDEFVPYIERKKQFHLYLWNSLDRKDCKEFWFDTLEKVYQYWYNNINKD